MKIRKAIIISTLLLTAHAVTIAPVYAQPAISDKQVQNQSSERVENGNEIIISESIEVNNDSKDSASEIINNSKSSDVSNDSSNSTDRTNITITEAGEESETSSSDNTSSNSASTDLILHINSTKIEQSGKAYKALRSTTVKQGVSYVSLRSLADRLGYKVGYDTKTKESLLSSKDTALKFKAKSKTYTVNGVSQSMSGAPYVDKGVMMVPLKAFVTAFNIKVVLQDTTIILQMPVVTPPETEPEQEPKPAPNEAPVAFFTTNKLSYRMGELVEYEDQSSDDEDAIKDRKWENNKLAFFEPGVVTISLTVTDKHGLSSVHKHEIEILSESLYSENDFNYLFTPVGSNFKFHGASVLGFEPLPFDYYTEPYTLFRASGPETVNSEGILYQDTIEGQTRFMIHHKNNLGEKAKFYVIAHNANEYDAYMDIERLGFAGPSIHPEVAGRFASARYFESSINGSAVTNIPIEAGEKKIIFEGLSNLTASSGDVVTLKADLISNAPIQYTVLMVKANNDPLTAIDTLPDLDPKESIVRGTFEDSTRVLEYNELVGTEPRRLPLTDNSTDLFQQGKDGIKHTDATNSGNYGVMYKIVLNRVAPNTIITFNPRGGLYSGSARVNDNVVHIKHIGRTQDTTSVLYRTKDQEEKVEIWITPAAGSNLPFALLFMPMPKDKE